MHNFSENDLYLDTEKINVGDRFTRLSFEEDGTRVADGTITCTYAGPGRYVFEITGSKEANGKVRIHKELLSAALFNKCPGIVKEEA